MEHLQPGHFLNQLDPLFGSVCSKVKIDFVMITSLMVLGLLTNHWRNLKVPRKNSLKCWWRNLLRVLYYLPTTLRLKVWLSLGTVDTWHSNRPASLAVTYFNFSVHLPCRDGINSYRSSWTNRSRPMKSICESIFRTHDTWNYSNEFQTFEKKFPK